MTPEETLRQLVEATQRLREAVLAGDFPAAHRALAQRAALVEGLEGGTLDGEQRTRLKDELRRGGEVRQMLAARRETLRAEFGAMEAERRRLGCWGPAGALEGGAEGWTG